MKNKTLRSGLVLLVAALCVLHVAAQPSAVPRASQAEVNAGANVPKYVSPDRLAAATSVGGGLLSTYWQTNTAAANSIQTSNNVSVANLNVTGALTFTNLFYYSRTNPVTGNPATNASMPWASPGKYHMGIVGVGVLFTNISTGIADGTWVNHLMTNATASTTHVYIPTNIFMLTNSGSFVQLDPFSGTNWDFFLSNGCAASLVLEATTGTELRNVHGYFVTYRP